MILNGQFPSCETILSGIPQGSATHITLLLLKSLLSPIYKYDLPNGLISICKIFADDKSISSIVFGRNSSNPFRHEISYIVRNIISF